MIGISNCYGNLESYILLLKEITSKWERFISSTLDSHMAFDLDLCQSIVVMSLQLTACHVIFDCAKPLLRYTCVTRELKSAVSFLKETPLVRCFVFLCESVEEWRIQNEWKVRTTHTSETSVSRARPQVFVSTLEHILTLKNTKHLTSWCFVCEPSGPDCIVTT